MKPDQNVVLPILLAIVVLYVLALEPMFRKLTKKDRPKRPPDDPTGMT